jgi:hypothetical protein
MGNTIFKFNDLSVDDVNAYRNIDVMYNPRTYKLMDGYIPIAYFDGKDVTVNKTKYFERFDYVENKKYVMDNYNDLTFALNSEQVGLCPFCSRPEHISAIIQGAEHYKDECHVGRRDHYFAQHTFFPHIVFKTLPQWVKQSEVDRVFKDYKFQGNGPKPIVRKPGLRGETAFAGRPMSLMNEFSELIHDLQLKHYPVQWHNNYLGDW